MTLMRESRPHLHRHLSSSETQTSEIGTTRHAFVPMRIRPQLLTNPCEHPRECSAGSGNRACRAPTQDCPSVPGDGTIANKFFGMKLAFVMVSLRAVSLGGSGTGRNYTVDRCTLAVAPSLKCSSRTALPIRE